MTTLREAAEQALEDLENEIFSGDWCECDYKVHHHDCSLGQIIKTLRAALAEPDAVAAEREACARACELLRPSKREYDHRFYDACTASAAVIRTRGKP